MLPAPITVNDFEELKALQPPEWDDITVPHQWYLESPKCIPLKWVSNGKICGIGTIIHHEDTAWLAHIIVHPAHRNKGLGGIITSALIEQVDRMKYKTIYLVATDLGYPVYQKVGFDLEAVYGHYTTKEKIIHNLSTFIIPYSEIFLEEVLALDRKISGEGREEKLKMHLHDALVFRREERVDGAYFPSLANGLIIAGNPLAGIELMKQRLQVFDFAICPLQNEAATSFLLENNFTEVRTSRRMRLGPKRDWQPTGVYNRVSGQIG